jgi:8-oxo-dGTP pyrophosphatase MutT (NUDIX family)
MIRSTKFKSDMRLPQIWQLRLILRHRLRTLGRARSAAEPAIRFGFHLYSRMSRELTLGVRGLVRDEAGRIFLVKHRYEREWHLPGGGVEPGETLTDALARELKEEGNIDLLEPPVLHAIYLSTAASQRDHVALFVIGAFRQPVPPVPNHEIMAYGFFAPDASPEDNARARRRSADGRAAVAALVRAQAPSAHAGKWSAVE